MDLRLINFVVCNYIIFIAPFCNFTNIITQLNFQNLIGVLRILLMYGIEIFK